MTTEARLNLEGKIGLICGLLVVGIWSCILVYGWFRMERPHPQLPSLSSDPQLEHLYVSQTLLTCGGFLILLGALLCQRRLRLVHWASLAGMLGGVSLGVAYSVERILVYFSDFYHMLGHHVFDQCTSEYRMYSRYSGGVLGLFAVAFVAIPLLVRIEARIKSSTTR